MSTNDLKDILELYDFKLNECAKEKYRGYDKSIIDEFCARVKMIVEVENEVLSYFQEAISTKIFKRPSFLWFVVAGECPTTIYINSLLELLKMRDLYLEDDVATPYWKVLDLLQYMPEEMTEPVAHEILEIIELDNLSWSDDDMVKAFEVANWIAPIDKEKDFIWRLCSSTKERLAKNAKRWKEWIECDEDEDE